MPPPPPGMPPGVRGRDPYGFGAPMPPHPAPPAPGVPPAAFSLDDAPQGSPGGSTPEAVLRDALSKASRELIEKIAWEVVPQLAEVIIRAELERLIREREAKG